MSKSYREAFQRALVRTFDWIRHSGPEPEVDLDGTSIAAQTLFDRMTKFGQDQMPAVEIQLTCEILGGIRRGRRHVHPIVWQCGKIFGSSNKRAKS